MSFDANMLQRTIDNAVKTVKNSEEYLVRFNPEAVKNFGFIDKRNLVAGSDMENRYNKAELLLSIKVGAITVLRDDKGRAGCIKMPNVKVVQKEELPWQKREREAKEAEEARVAMRASVRSTLGL